MIPKSFRSATTALVGTLSLAAAGHAFAQAYPDRPVTLVVPFAAGGPTDVVARMMSVPMAKSLGQQVVVENTVGAGGTIAATRVARAKPDGYTIFIHHMGMSTAPALYRKLNFDPLNDYEYVGQVVDVPMTLLARKDFPANTLPELLAYIKANKDKVTLANAGLGAVSHLCGLLFQSAIGVDMTTVPYKGTGPAMTDLLGGQVDLLCDQTTQTVPLIKEGRVKVFGVTVSKRLAALPNVPTLDEQGMKGFEVKVWHGMYAPKGTPAPVLEKINAALRAAMEDPTVKQRMVDLSADIVPPEKMTAAGLKTFLESEIAKWGPVIKKAGVFAD
ncbi:MAG: tripartite tricarboxylate transporter substrate binding protein BugD [Burkholderiaceae bacterium]|jgi:tripartite-type tricarboxylate transporter receptor subunit TctC|nr:tripartite tricarboxylate transporter substrate binding protein BugD [Burkholderiales bacterium]MCZ8103377.1 tripartite tricarboxylate transporter substrate binding protein BugD [Burkholderiales bacterium]MCZ8337533.1 tripartite tricarboxylate transporter substrate binding protein BugD [Burkholderiaceae bacterium]